MSIFFICIIESIARFVPSEFSPRTTRRGERRTDGLDSRSRGMAPTLMRVVAALQTDPPVMPFPPVWQPLRRKLPLLNLALLLVAMAATAGLAYRALTAELLARAGERAGNVSVHLARSFSGLQARLEQDKRRPHADSVFVAYLRAPGAATERAAREVLELNRESITQAASVELWVGGERRLASTSPGFVDMERDTARVRSGFPTGFLIGPLLLQGDTVLLEARLPVISVAGDTVAIVRQLQHLAGVQGVALVQSLIGRQAILLIGNRTGTVWTDMARRVPSPASRLQPGVITETEDQGGTRWVGAAATVAHTPWMVWVALPRESVIAPAAGMLRDIALLLGVLLVLGTLASYAIARHLLRPLERMTGAAERIASGDYSSRLRPDSTDERGRLAGAFDAMTDHIATATSDLEAQHLEVEVGNQELSEAIDRANRNASDLRAIVDAAPSGICTFDTDGRVLSWNLAAERMFGWTAGEVLGRPLPTIAESEPSQFAEFRALILSGQRLQSHVVRRLRKDGCAVDVRLTGAPLYGRDGEIIGLLAMLDDVTERMTAEAQLVSERHFLRQIIDINPHFIFAKDRCGRFTLANQAVAEAYGTTTDQLIGKTDADFSASSAEAEGFRLADNEVMDSGRTRMIPEERITAADGSVRWLQTVKRPIFGADGRPNQVLGVSTDITERKQLAAQLVQSQKMEAVGQLAGGVAHDFNNVLAAIKGFAELITFELDERSPIRADLSEISAAADRAATLTQQLLAFSRRQLLQPVLLSANTVADGVNKMLLRLMGAEVRCEMQLAPDLALVLADRGQLEQVLMNLAVNARDAMPNGGTVTIATSNVTLDFRGAASLSTLDAVIPGDYVCISVTDTGTGMSKATQARIFEPFFTTKAAGTGTGLGLSTVYGIVRQSGGYVTVCSEPGAGTRLSVYLPRVEGTVAATPVPRRPAPAHTAAETILVVDDDASVLTAAARILARAGYEVLPAASPEEAESISTAFARDIHLLMTDVMMPQMNGGELARRILLARPAIRVLYTSGYTNDAVIGRGFITSDTVFLAKPFTLADVVGKVREALEG